MAPQMPDQRSVQRSFRLSAQTAAYLDSVAEEGEESRNSLVERLLRESLRRERHPLVTFRTGGSGLRRPALLGTRMDVHHVIATVRAEGGDLAAAAAHFELDPRVVRAAVDYYAEYADEVDRHLAEDERVAARERALWERAQTITS